MILNQSGVGPSENEKYRIFLQVHTPLCVLGDVTGEHVA